MERVEAESRRLLCSDLADESVWGKPLQGLQAASEIVCRDEVAEIGSGFIVGLVEVAFDGFIAECPLHSLHLPVGPGTHAAKSRPEPNVSVGGASVWMVVMIMGPMPGISISRGAPSSCLARTVIAVTRRSMRCRNAPSVSTRS